MKKFLLIIIVLLTSANQLVLAANPTFTTYPTYSKNQNKWIVRDANPGTHSQDYITLSNLSEQSIELTLSIKELGGTKEKPLILDNKTYQNIGKWTSLEKSQVTLEPHATTNIKISLYVPADTKLGQYQEVILVSHISKNSSNLDINTRLGNRLYLNVTNQQDLQANTQNLSISPLQITLIIVASLGIVITLLTPSKQK